METCSPLISTMKTLNKMVIKVSANVQINRLVNMEHYIYHYNFKRFQKKLNQSAPVEYRHALVA
jgi:hypothetical protein